MIYVLICRPLYFVELIQLSNSNCQTSKTPLWRRSPTGSTICNACGLYYKARHISRPMALKRATSTTTSAPPSEYDATDLRKSASPSSSSAPTSSQPGDAAHSAGSCPGGGRCNGTGGADGCNGCPAYNNRISKKAQPNASIISRPPRVGDGVDENREGSTHDDNTSMSGTNDTPGANTNASELSCRNCGTTITPLWRRDESGHTICNACGMFKPQYECSRLEEES